MPISRMQQPRQLYGLGSIVKKIGRAAKKVVKSDLGKAALTAAALYYSPSLIPGGARTMGGVFSNIGKAGGISPYLFGTAGTGAAAGGGGTLGVLADLGITKGFGAKALTGKGIAASIAAPSILGAALTPEAQEDVDQLKASGDQGLLKAYLERYYRNLNPDADDETVSSFVRTNMARGGDTAEENAMQASGIMNLPLNQNPAGVTELDLRETGGFIPPVGVKEKADDIPAMLSNNEFVFTADAVRGMGDGDVNRGAQRMYAMMKKLEDGGRV